MICVVCWFRCLFQSLLIILFMNSQPLYHSVRRKQTVAASTSNHKRQKWEEKITSYHWPVHWRSHYLTKAHKTYSRLSIAVGLSRRQACPSAFCVVYLLKATSPLTLNLEQEVCMVGTMLDWLLYDVLSLFIISIFSGILFASFVDFCHFSFVSAWHKACLSLF